MSFPLVRFSLSRNNDCKWAQDTLCSCGAKRGTWSNKLESQAYSTRLNQHQHCPSGFCEEVYFAFFWAQSINLHLHLFFFFLLYSSLSFTLKITHLHFLPVSKFFLLCSPSSAFLWFSRSSFTVIQKLSQPHSIWPAHRTTWCAPLGASQVGISPFALGLGWMPKHGTPAAWIYPHTCFLASLEAKDNYFKQCLSWWNRSMKKKKHNCL